MDAPFRLADEVREALASGRPVVALETSVVAQGLPPPHRLERNAAVAGEIAAALAVAR
jgi:pseudouridine-5'-phosphate glycosidase